MVRRSKVWASALTRIDRIAALTHFLECLSGCESLSHWLMGGMDGCNGWIDVNQCSVNQWSNDDPLLSSSYSMKKAKSGFNKMKRWSSHRSQRNPHFYLRVFSLVIPFGHVAVLVLCQVLASHHTTPGINGFNNQWASEVHLSADSSILWCDLFFHFVLMWCLTDARPTPSMLISLKV